MKSWLLALSIAEVFGIYITLKFNNNTNNKKTIFVVDPSKVNLICSHNVFGSMILLFFKSSKLPKSQLIYTQNNKLELSPYQLAIIIERKTTSKIERHELCTLSMFVCISQQLILILINTRNMMTFLLNHVHDNIPIYFIVKLVFAVINNTRKP